MSFMCRLSNQRRGCSVGILCLDLEELERTTVVRMGSAVVCQLGLTLRLNVAVRDDLGGIPSTL